MKKRYFAAACAAISLAAISFAAFKADDRNFKVSKNLDIFLSVFKELDLNYVEAPDPDRIVPEAINSMLSELDPYTVYIPEKDKEAYKFQVDGEYGGVGAIIALSNDTNLINIKEIYRNTPSDKAGLRAGDRFLEINGESMRGKRVDEVSSKLRGKAGDEIKIKIERPGQPKPLDFKFKREVIKLDAMEYYGMLDSQTGYISLRGFESGCAEAIKKAFLDLRDNKGAKSLILDLRGNAGGLLDESLQIVNFFVPKGVTTLETKGRRKFMDRVYSSFREPLDTLMPMAVMIDRGSASASEIVAGSLQDLDRAVIVGQRSFGKGLVQATREVAYDGLLKLTTAKYYTPSGRCIQAIDYSTRDENGAVDYVPDSLISEFHTRHGRKVFDGGGISPDVMLDRKEYKPVCISVVMGDYPFRFALSFLAQNKPLPIDADGHISDKTYADFIAFMKAQPKFSYKTATQIAFDRLVAAAKAENLYDGQKAAIDALAAPLAPNIDRDMADAKAQVVPLIEDEMVRIKGYKTAAFAHAIQYDEHLKTAIEILNDQKRYYGLLDGSVPSHAGDKRAALSKKKSK
ncbi:MAG: S41 family peptidase [Bacteroidales bacterium]|nr:S41 family peptidase [Bacteroidales bacterium]MDY4173949.1 S41 family peptidase [Bacteroidales bacterium]